MKEAVPPVAPPNPPLACRALPALAAGGPPIQTQLLCAAAGAGAAAAAGASRRRPAAAVVPAWSGAVQLRTDTLAPLRRWTAREESAVAGVAASPDGRLLAAWTADSLLIAPASTPATSGPGGTELWVRDISGITAWRWK